MDKSDKVNISAELEIQRYIDEMIRYQKRSNNPKPLVDEPVIPAIVSSFQTQQVVAPVAPSTALVQAPQESYESYKKANPETGYLKVKTFTARRAFPVKNAVVEVSKNFPSGRYLISQLVTNQDGITDVIELPTPSKQLSEVPGTPNPFTTVDIKIKHKEFVEMNFFDVPVFQGITSIQKADLLPLAAAPDGTSSVDIAQTEPSDL
ncbi:MAG: hypothetical protein WAX04_00990 [Oscillospiraceae bacterium]